MDRGSRPRQATEFLAMDLGVRAAKVICDRFDAQVMDYAADGHKASITLKMPSRRELFHRSMEMSRAVMSGAEEARRRTAETLLATKTNRHRNEVLRSSVSEVRQALRATRNESRRLLEGIYNGSGSQPAGR